jgi:hypothetical protein
MDNRMAYIGNPGYGVIVDFLRGERAEWDGRWLSDIRTWDNEQLVSTTVTTSNGCSRSAKQCSRCVSVSLNSWNLAGIHAYGR